MLSFAILSSSAARLAPEVCFSLHSFDFFTSRLRSNSPWALIAEAGWRGIRILRQTTFHAGQDDVCPVRFQPIGYYTSQDDAARQAILAYADAILRGDYPLLGYGSPHLGTNPDWQCDWVSGKSWPLQDSRKLPIVRHDGSDVKAPWELSRLQWSPVVANAWLLTGERRYRDALRSVLTDWVARNPVGKGVNWTVAMEAALRAISLCLTMELLWPFADQEKAWMDQITASLWQHLRFIEANSEFSFLVRSNHYLSNLVGLTTLSAYLHGPGIERRFRKYARAVQREILIQTYPDGGDREASTGYHVLVAQMFLHSLVVQRRCRAVIAPEFESRLRRMFEWIGLAADDEWKLPHLGDCDNGRVELLCEDIAQAPLPAGDRHGLRVGSLCTLASHRLQFPARSDKASALLPHSGIGVVRSGEASVVFCAMPNGLGGKGSHTHCDKLSVVFRLGPVEVFCDSGSRCYTRSARMRNLDRSTAAHNTLSLDGADQNILSADPQLLFQCGNQAAVSSITISESSMEASHRGYERFGVEHRRKVELSRHSLLVQDDVSGAGEHVLSLRYILGPEWRVSSEMMSGMVVSCLIAGPRRLTFECEAASALALSVLPTAVSREYGVSLPGSCIRIQTTAPLPAGVQTRVLWN